MRNLERADPFGPNIEAIYSLRLLQGLAGGLIIPLLMATAFRVLTPNIRLYKPCRLRVDCDIHAALAATVVAFWTDVVDWRFVFLQTIPLCSLAGVLVWYCLHQDQPRYERFRMLDWRAASGYWERRLEHHALSGGPARLVQLKTDLRPGSDERLRHSVAAGQ